jgi:predicted Zn-dependent peptidase
MNHSGDVLPSFASSIKDNTLSNGLKVICLKKTGAPIVSMQVWYKTGSYNETDGIRGISHFFEHMMFRGSKKYGSEEHARKINDVGGHYNAFTAEDVTAYLNSVPKNHLDMVFDLEADRMINLSINKEVLETERNVIVEEFQTYMNNPLTKSFLEFRKDFFKGHPYTYSALGRLEDIKTVTVDDCMTYYRTWYSPSNAVLVVVGDFDNCEIIFQKAEQVFGAIPASQSLPQNKTVVPFIHPAASWVKNTVDFDVPVCIIGYPAPAASHADALPLELMQLIMSQGESSRLHREVVRKKSLAVMAGGMNQCLKHAGMSLFFSVFTPNVSQKKVEVAVVAEIETSAQNGVLDAEIEKVKNAALTNRTFELYSGEHICQKLGYAQTIEGDYKSWVGRLIALNKMDAQTLKNAALTYWNAKNRHVLYLKPKRIKPMLFIAGILRKIIPGM